jgi:hypothetical protein
MRERVVYEFDRSARVVSARLNLLWLFSETKFMRICDWVIRVDSSLKPLGKIFTHSARGLNHGCGRFFEDHCFVSLELTNRIIWAGFDPERNASGKRCVFELPGTFRSPACSGRSDEFEYSSKSFS